MTFERRYFLLLLTTAAVGVGYSYYKIGSIQSILNSLAAQYGNDLNYALSPTAGAHTLRYASILAAPIGIYLWRNKAVGLPYMITAVLVLLLESMLSNRLALFMAGAVYFVIWVKTRNWSRRKTPWHPHHWIAAVAILVIGFAVLTALNYFRNANYYRHWEVSGSVAMNVYQMGAYLAVPAQVSLGTSDALMTGTWEVRSDPVNSLKAILPTFLQEKKVSRSDYARHSAEYGHSVTFASEFTTNSVFADTYADYGMWGWLYSFALYGFAGYLFARLVRYGVVIAGSGGVIAYSFAEVWRTSIVNDGIVVFLLLLTAGCAFVAASESRRPNVKR